MNNNQYNGTFDIDLTLSPTLNYNDNRACYLLLQIHIKHYNIGKPLSTRCIKSINVAKEAGKSLGIMIWPIRLIYKGHESGNYVYIFRYPRYKKDDLDAVIIGESYFLSLSFTFGPWADLDDTQFVYCFPSELIHDGTLFIDDLMEYEESRPYNERTIENPTYTFGRSFSTSEYDMDAAWKITPYIYKNRKLKQSLRFLVESQENFFVWPGGIDDAIDQSDYIPKTSFEQIKFENALQNAFKSIEAIIGDPSKDDRKLFVKLREVGVDPTEKIGLDQEPISEIIRKMNIARDKKAAHGSTFDRDITVGEMLDYQFCARYILLSAIEHELNEPLY